MKRKAVVIGLIVWAGVMMAETLRVVSYNVENLFHPAHDSVNGIAKDDYEWTPEGERRWSYTRYYRKEENIARVLTNIGEWDGVDIAGLQETENAAAVKRLCYTLRRNEYGFVHYESPDERGIDVALVYKTARIDTLKTEKLKVKSEKFSTRDILYVCAQVDKKDTLHLFVCHLPSQRGGKAESEWKRATAKRVLQNAVDSVFRENAEAKIIVMGDFNSEPHNDIQGLSNCMIPIQQAGKGTHKYQGHWMCLDQFYVSPSVHGKASVYDAEWIMETDEKYLGMKPKRTYNGFRYQNGFSDHLPIILDAELR